MLTLSRVHGLLISICIWTKPGKSTRRALVPPIGTIVGLAEAGQQKSEDHIKICSRMAGVTVLGFVDLRSYREYIGGVGAKILCSAWRQDSCRDASGLTRRQFRWPAAME